MVSSVLMSVALCIPGGHPADCAGAGTGYSNGVASSLTGPPVIRVFERRAEDAERRANWNAYCRELDQLWLQYRASGSTPEAWRSYVAAADQAKLRYVSNDPYLVPIVGR
jgi:hypothetical protein